VGGPEERLCAGVEALGLAVRAGQIQAWLGYLDLLVSWNRVYNLTAVHGPAKMVTRHVLDSLAVHPHVQGPRVADVGTGAGLPGIPLAVLRPDTGFVLIDANAKKTRFINQVTIELGLSNVAVVHARIEDYHERKGFDTVLSRAFADLKGFVGQAAPLCAPQGRMLAMKGRYPGAELAALPAAYRARVHPLKVPGLEAQRHVVVISPGAHP
jgi:16S rRNA (guanine527-N7)-methyltransferase